MSVQKSAGTTPRASVQKRTYCAVESKDSPSCEEPHKGIGIGHRQPGSSAGSYIPGPGFHLVGAYATSVPAYAMSVGTYIRRNIHQVSTSIRKAGRSIHASLVPGQ
eukprot:337454-Rhodomonas_salina.2